MASGPATAEGYWFFGKKKTEKAAPEGTSIFNKPEKKSGMGQDKGNTSFMSKLFGRDEKKSEAAKDVVINGITFKGLKPEMMKSSYIPKTPDEIMLVAFAHKSWEGDITTARAADAQKRISNALQKSDEAVRKMREAGAKEMVGAQQASVKAKAVPAAGEQSKPATKAAAPPVKQIFNKPEAKKPSKVFKNYR